MNEQVKDTTPKKKGKGKLITALILTLVLAGGVAAGIYFYQQNANYLTTDNASVKTALVHVVPSMQGTLERFTVSAGSYVAENEIIGWIENGEVMRSPVDGVVLHTSASQGQVVSPQEAVAVIGDINRIHIEANISENDIRTLQLGQRAIVTIDTFGNRQFEGYISEIARITTAELSGQSTFFNTGGTFTRVTHLIPIKITLVDDVDLNSLIGVNARVQIPLAGHNASVNQSVSAFTDNRNTPVATVRINAAGKVESVLSRNVYSSAGMNVERVYVSVGDYVKVGQTLAVLDSADLEFSIAQQKAVIESMRITGSTSINDARRMLNEASANLANNTNIQIISAETALNTALFNLSLAQRDYDIFMTDYADGNIPNILSAESALESARIELEAMEITHKNLALLVEAGFVSRDELRQSETSLTLMRNNYNDAQIMLNLVNAAAEQNAESLRLNIRALETEISNARIFLNATQTTATQEIEQLRGILTNAENAANLLQMEIALEQLERQLNELTITAPNSGTVTAVMINEGEPGAGLMFVIEDTENLKIITGFRESDISRIEVGMSVIITSSATGNAEYTGIINRINPAASVVGSFVVIEAEVLVTSDNTDLRIGTNVNINVILESEGSQ